MHKPTLPTLTYSRRLDYHATWTRFKQFFTRFPYEAFNARKCAEKQPQDQIHHRRANVYSCAQEIFRLVVDRVRKKQRPGAPLHFSLATFRPSLATSTFRSTKSIDRYLRALRQMGFLTAQQRTSHGVELVVTASLFIFVGQPTPSPPTPMPAPATSTSYSAPARSTVSGEDDLGDLDPWQQSILRFTALAERVAKKFGVYEDPASD